MNEQEVDMAIEDLDNDVQTVEVPQDDYIETPPMHENAASMSILSLNDSATPLESSSANPVSPSSVTNLLEAANFAVEDDCKIMDKETRKISF